jgi:hypothetical protein
MEQQHGVVIVFRPGTPMVEIERQLYLMRQIIDPHFHRGEIPKVHTFNPEHGTPCWYIP